jgi:hypothetical protein
VTKLREPNVRPYGAPNISGRRATVERRTTRHRGHALIQPLRKRIERAFGWIKTAASLRRPRCRGLARVDLTCTFAAVACDLAGVSS